MKKLLLPAIVFAAIALFGYSRHHSPFSGAPTSAAAANDSVLASVFEKHASNIQVEGQGTVAMILPDDNDGSRHQRFIVRLSSGHWTHRDSDGRHPAGWIRHDGQDFQ